MATTNLGRVQGAGFFYTTASSGTTIAISTLTPTNISPLVGDCVIFPNGDVRKIIASTTSTITCGSVVASFKGPTGDTGAQGETGNAAGFGTPTASVDANTGTPSVTITASGANTAKVFNFSFKNLKGEKGDTGATGAQGEKGDTGATGAKGDKGDPFTVAKVYASVAEMNAGYSTDGVAEGGFVVIDTGDVEDEDNAKLYVKGSTAYTYLTDLSGAQGMKGEKGETGATGAQGPQGETGPKGETGATGAAAGFGTPTASVDANTGTPSVTITATGADTAKVFNFAFKNLKGEKGDTGAQGEKGEDGVTPTLSISNGELIATY